MDIRKRLGTVPQKLGYVRVQYALFSDKAPSIFVSVWLPPASTVVLKCPVIEDQQIYM